VDRLVWIVGGGVFGSFDLAFAVSVAEGRQEKCHEHNQTQRQCAAVHGIEFDQGSRCGNRRSEGYNKRSHWICGIFQDRRCAWIVFAWQRKTCRCLMAGQVLCSCKCLRPLSSASSVKSDNFKVFGPEFGPCLQLRCCIPGSFARVGSTPPTRHRVRVHKASCRQRRSRSVQKTACDWVWEPEALA